jgi:hypothetical protein
VKTVFIGRKKSWFNMAITRRASANIMNGWKKSDVRGEIMVMTDGLGSH